MRDKTAIDIIIDGFQAQWNRTKAFATDPKSINEVGCIHTTQGMEFEYVGLIVATSLLLLYLCHVIFETQVFASY